MSENLLKLKLINKCYTFGYVQLYLGVFKKPKKGFGPPVSLWLRTFLSDFLKETLSKDGLSQSPLNYDFIKQMMNEHFHRKADHGRTLWSILIFHLWWNRYVRNIS